MNSPAAVVHLLVICHIPFTGIGADVHHFLVISSYHMISLSITLTDHAKSYLGHLPLHVRVLQHGVAAKEVETNLKSNNNVWQSGCDLQFILNSEFVPIENNLCQTFLLIIHRHFQVRRQHFSIGKQI